MAKFIFHSFADRGTPGGVRSTSAIDLQAAQRAKARLMYANMSRQKAAALREYKHTLTNMNDKSLLIGATDDVISILSHQLVRARVRIPM